MMYDCWKKSCHGATVVPTMAITRSITVDSGALCGKPGTTKFLATSPIGGWTIPTSGTNSSEKATSVRQRRSKRRKLPVLTAPMTATAATTTVGNFGNPR